MTIEKALWDPETKKAFSAAIAAYGIIWTCVIVYLLHAFGLDRSVVWLSVILILIVPLIIALRMHRRWPKVRGREFTWLIVLLIFVLMGGAYVVGYWHDAGLDKEHARNVRFVELTRLVDKDPVFNNIELIYQPFKVGNGYYCIKGSVPTQADLEHLQMLCDQYGFVQCVKDVAVINDVPSSDNSHEGIK
jgi:hypothetical protein